MDKAAKVLKLDVNMKNRAINEGKLYECGTMNYLKNTYRTLREWEKKRGRKLKNKRQKEILKAFYSQYVKSGQLCFDVGANMGNRTDILLQLGAKVVAVEPQESCCRHLTGKFGNNPNFTLVTKAMDEIAGQIRQQSGELNRTETTFLLMHEFRKWAEDKGMDFVPIPTFLSAFALGRYLSVVDSQTVEVTDDDILIELSHSEMLVGRAYINNYVVMRGSYKFKDAVEELRPILSLSWLKLYDSGNRGLVVLDAIRDLAVEYGLNPKGCHSYADITDGLI